MSLAEAHNGSRRKRRPARPFAVMVSNEASVQHIAAPNLAEQAHPERSSVITHGER